MTAFKDKSMQKMYDACRAFAADKSSSFYVEGKPRRGAGHRAAYWNGRAGIKTPGADRNSLAYACWRAGMDDRKQFGPVEGAEYQFRVSRIR